MCSEGLWTCTVKYSWNSRGERHPGKSLGPGRDPVKLKGREKPASPGQTLCGAFHGELLQRDFVLASLFSRVSGVWLQARKFDLLSCPLYTRIPHSGAGLSVCTKWDFYLK